MNNGNKPKLELQVNVPIKIKLLQDKPGHGQSSVGPWWLYNVEDETKTEYSFFAPEPVQSFIETNQLKKDDEIQITKSITKNGKTNMVDFKVELLTRQEPKPVNVNGQKPDDSIKIMRECYLNAIELQKELGGSYVDVNRVALSLYISKTKNGNGYQF